MYNYKYAGAGVIIIEIIDSIPYIILGYDRFRKMYTDFGGRFEKNKHDNIKDVAHMELIEESCGLFNISQNKLKYYVDTKYYNRIYRTYFIILKNINIKHYVKNRNKLKINKVPKHWLETSKLTKVPIYNIYNCKPKDINGNNIKIHNRVLVPLKKMLYKIHIIPLTQIHKIKNKNLYNTISYKSI